MAVPGEDGLGDGGQGVQVADLRVAEVLAGAGAHLGVVESSRVGY